MRLFCILIIFYTSSRHMPCVMKKKCITLHQRHIVLFTENAFNHFYYAKKLEYLRTTLILRILISGTSFSHPNLLYSMIYINQHTTKSFLSIRPTCILNSVVNIASIPKKIEKRQLFNRGNKTAQGN